MKWIKNHIALGWAASGLLLALILVSTSPGRVGPQGVTLFFGVFYTWSFFSFALLSGLLAPKRLKSLKQSSHFFMIASLAAVPTFVLALQSLGQLALRDVFIVLSLALLIIFYWTKRGYN